jgi:hypothetical protein
MIGNAARVKLVKLDKKNEKQSVETGYVTLIIAKILSEFSKNPSRYGIRNVLDKKKCLVEMNYCKKKENVIDKQIDKRGMQIYLTRQGASNVQRELWFGEDSLEIEDVQIIRDGFTHANLNLNIEYKLLFFHDEDNVDNVISIYRQNSKIDNEIYESVTSHRINSFFVVAVDCRCYELEDIMIKDTYFEILKRI